jgi:hypothetical protein
VLDEMITATLAAAAAIAVSLMSRPAATRPNATPSDETRLHGMQKAGPGVPGPGGELFPQPGHVWVAEPCLSEYAIVYLV